MQKIQKYILDKMGKFSIPNKEMVNYGCRNCVWRLHGQCPHDIQEGEVYKFTVGNGEAQKDDTSKRKNRSGQEGKQKDTVVKGYCPEFADFIVSFAEPEDSVSAVWEKFSIYMAKLQSMEDYKNYMKLESRIKELEHGVGSSDELRELETKRENLKLWWFKLNDQVRLSYGRVVDRERRSQDAKSRPNMMIHTKQVNFTPQKQIEDDSKKD